MESVRLLTDYTSSYRSHEDIYVEIEKQDPAGAAKRMMEHFALIEWRAGQSKSMPSSVDGSK
jgi:DNA-binding GntR family transcriptional regulator